MSFMKFFSSFGQAKLENGLKSGAAALARLDPEAATQAQIDMLNKKLSDLRGRLVKAQKAYEKDLAETADWAKKEQQTLQALTILKGQYEADPQNSTIIGKAQRLRSSLDNIKQNVERERGEDAQAKAILDQVQDLYNRVKTRRDEMRSKLGDAKQRMEQAKIREEQANMREQEAKELSNMEGSFNDLGIALDAMNKAAEDADQKAREANLSADEAMEARPSGDTDDILNEVLNDKKASSSSSDPFAGL